jgi:hypothetical protein
MEKINKERKILGLNFDGENLHFDLRFSFPVENISGELIKDLIDSNNGSPIFEKHQLINGKLSSDERPIWINYYIIIGEDENGNDTFSFVKRAKELN